MPCVGKSSALFPWGLGVFDVDLGLRNKRMFRVREWEGYLTVISSGCQRLVGNSEEFIVGTTGINRHPLLVDHHVAEGFAGGGVRIEGSSPSLFVRTDTVRAVRRGDTLTINGEMFWVDRVSPDDGGSCYLWLNRGQPPAVNRRR